MASEHGFFTGTVRSPAFIADLGTTIFDPSFLRFNSGLFHWETLRAQRNTIFTDGDIVFINRRSATFPVQINKRGDIVCFTVIIVRHRIMCGVEEQLFLPGLWVSEAFL